MDDPKAGICVSSCATSCCAPQSGLFRGLDPNEVHTLLAHARPKLLPAGEILFNAGDEVEYVYWVRAGRIKLFDYVSLDRTQTFGLCGPGSILGVDALFGHPLRLSAQAIQNTRCCALERNAVRETAASSPTFAFALLERLNSRLSDTYNRVAALSHFSTEKRLRQLLAELLTAQSLDSCPIADTKHDLNLTQEQIAEILGTSRESISRAFTSLQRQGLLEFRTGTIYVRKPEELLLDNDGELPTVYRIFSTKSDMM